MMLGRVGIITSSFMRRRWRESIVVLAALTALLPGTDPVTMMAEFIPVLILYGLSYFLVRAVEPKRDRAADAAPEPL
jgi:sec-independent protein translocase protein TatC